MYNYSTVASAVAGSGILDPSLATPNEISHLEGRRFGCTNIPYNRDVTQAPPDLTGVELGAENLGSQISFSLYGSPIAIGNGESLFAPWNADHIGYLTQEGLNKIFLPKDVFVLPGDISVSLTLDPLNSIRKLCAIL